VLSLVLVLGNVFKQLLDLLVNHDVPLEYIVSFIAYILPFSLTFTIPWGFLTAVLLVFGKMSAENELIALRANGVSISRICIAVFVLAAVASGICLWINVDVAPRAQQKMKSALFNIATSNPIAMFGSDQVIDEFPGKKIYVGKKEGTNLEDILMYDLNDKDDPMSVVHARRGALQADLEGKQQILLRLTDARYEQRDSAEPNNLMKIRQGITMDKIDLPISLKELYEKNKRRRGLSQMTLEELLKNKDRSHDTAARTEVNKRFSFSLASFAFALIGVPLAITAHRRETSIGFLFSLVIAFVYFFFIIIADAVRDNPKAHPELLIWAPNILFIGLGGWLFWRLAKK
ncbi:MAG: lipopolysaccharide export system permease protein, partial [Chthoniobacter sp.]|nr:lipopolysaccharide export system permease protein [Chthoniobacter sp.]